MCMDLRGYMSSGSKTRLQFRAVPIIIRSASQLSFTPHARKNQEKPLGPRYLIIDNRKFIGFLHKQKLSGIYRRKLTGP